MIHGHFQIFLSTSSWFFYLFSIALSLPQAFCIHIYQSIAKYSTTCFSSNPLSMISSWTSFPLSTACTWPHASCWWRKYPKRWLIPPTYIATHLFLKSSCFRNTTVVGAMSCTMATSFKEYKERVTERNYSPIIEYFNNRKHEQALILPKEIGFF